MKEEEIKKERDLKKEEEIEEVRELVSTTLSETGMKEDDVDDLRTMFHQDLLTMKEAKEKGLDSNEGFRVIRCGNDEDRPFYRVFGTEGREEKVKNELKTMKKSPYRVGNESVPCYKEKRWMKVLGYSLEDER